MKRLRAWVMAHIWAGMMRWYWFEWGTVRLQQGFSPSGRLTFWASCSRCGWETALFYGVDRDLIGRAQRHQRSGCPKIERQDYGRAA